MRKKRRGRTQKFETQKENKQKKNVRINGGRMALTIFIVVMVFFLLISVKSIFTLRAEQKELKDQNNALLLEKESLEDELKNVSDKEYIEEQARIQLKLIKPGEILYILEDNKDKEDNEKKDEKEN